jgi:hypothetical protein
MLDIQNTSFRHCLRHLYSPLLQYKGTVFIRAGACMLKTQLLRALCALYIYHCIYHPSDLQCLAGGQASWLNYIICEVKSLIASNEHTGNVRHTLCYITTFHTHRHHQPGLLPTTIITGEQSESIWSSAIFHYITNTGSRNVLCNS